MFFFVCFASVLFQFLQADGIIYSVQLLGHLYVFYIFFNDF